MRTCLLARSRDATAIGWASYEREHMPLHVLYTLCRKRRIVDSITTNT